MIKKYYEQIDKINGSKFTLENYGNRTCSPLPPFEVNWDLKPPSLELRSCCYDQGWKIVGWTDSPCFQHKERPGDPDIAILFEDEDGFSAWWHFVA